MIDKSFEFAKAQFYKILRDRDNKVSFNKKLARFYRRIKYFQSRVKKRLVYRNFANRMIMNYWDRIYIEYKTKAIQSHSDDLMTLCTEIEQIPRPVVIEMIRLIVMQSLKHCWLNYFKARLENCEKINKRFKKPVVDEAEVKLQIHKIE